MPYYSKQSKQRLAQCHPDLQRLFNEVIKDFDCSILCGHRNETEQQAAYENGTSKAQFGESKHNQLPSIAVDVVPYPIDWNDRERFALLAGFVLAKAKELNIKIRWGGDWDSDYQLKDENFSDMPHYELVL